MKKGNAQFRQPAAHEIQPLLNLYNAGQLQQAEATAKALLQVYPNAPILHNVLGPCLAGQRKFEEAAVSFKRVVAAMPNSAELHFNLATVLANLGRHDEAVTNYKKAAAIKPSYADAYFNLGISQQAIEKFEDAVASYRRAIAIEPGFFEAHGNLGTVLQQQGKLDEAISSYQKALNINPDARGHFNLATALRDKGKLDDAIAAYRQAISLYPNYVQAHNNLGEALRDQGKMDEAVASYHQALAIDPNHEEASYNIAQFLYDAGDFQQAIAYFEKSKLGDWQERQLYCLYKAEQYDAFKQKLQPLLQQRNVSPFLATLSTHYATNFGVEDSYDFCKTPMDFVYHNSIGELAGEDSELLSDLLRDIEFAEIAERKQGRLHHGIQSAGNLFKRSEASFIKLSQLIKKEVEAYQQRFADADCELVRSFPQQTEFSSSWYVKMRTGGHLTSHIHETGWLSGSVYLSLPKKKVGQDDGSIEFSTHGDHYPQKHTNFPVKVIAPKLGDIVLFPSSLFHRTIPFTSDEERICVAFDIKPRSFLPGIKLLTAGWLCAMGSELIDALLISRFVVA